MNPTDFSVLLLAWDDADPGVAVLGGSALPPTLPLVYELATHHPVVALYPHLPAAETDTPAPSWPEPGFIPDPLDVATDGPGVRLLPAAPAAPFRPDTPAIPTPAGSSRLVGLDDLLPPIQAVLVSAHRLASASGTVLPGVASRPAASPVSGSKLGPGCSQWPTPPGPPGTWRAPAAPYAGANATTSASTATQPAPPPAAARPAGLHHPADQLLLPPPPRPPATSVPIPAFQETVEEMGSAEARDLDASEDDLLPDEATSTPVVASVAVAVTKAATTVPTVPGATPDDETAMTTAADQTATSVRTLRQPRLDGLNFRMIQYARRAMQLVSGHSDFSVIYAPCWPAWLAALEIRNRTGRPLVLYAAALASDTAAPAERGWLLGIERMALRRAHLVLVPDAGVEQQLRQHHGADLGEIRIVAAHDETTIQLVLAEVALG